MQGGNFQACCCMESPDRARPQCIWRRCDRCLRPGGRRSCWFQKLDSLLPLPPICIKFSETRLRFCTRRFPISERAEQWHRIKRGEARMVVGTRSAVFAPVSDLALIIVDEEHDSSYKQEETPRYHARDVAVMRAKMSNAVVVLGSATPSLESYFNAKKNKYALLELPDRVEQRPLPEVEIIDMRLEFQETGHEQVISRKLAAEIKERLERREQVMVLLNRRGYSPVALCRTCGKKLECSNCAIAMTHHKREHRWCATTVDTRRPCRRLAFIAAVNMYIFSAQDPRSWKSCCMECFRRRGLRGLIAIRSAARKISSAR